MRLIAIKALSLLWLASALMTTGCEREVSDPPPERHAAPIPQPVPPHDFALQFDGSQSRVLVNGLRYLGKTPLTIEVWTELSASSHGNLFCNMERGGLGFGMFYGQCWFTMHNGKKYMRAKSSAIAELGRTHLAGVFDGSELRVFVNGQPAGQLPLQGKYHRSPLPFMVGANPKRDGIENPYNGIIDELRVSVTSRYAGAFTPPERFTADDDTVLLYYFDEGQGAVVADASGNHHAGRIINAFWVPDDE